MDNIINRIPTAVITCVTMEVRFWLTVLLMVSTSLVIMLKISPWVLAS